MTDFKQQSERERNAIISIVADKIGVRPDMIEKDYWVSWCLNQIFSDEKLSAIFLFKGGTSLSKSYRIINRFSEDIDLLLDLHEVAGATEDFEKERTKNAINKFKKEIIRNTEKYIADILLPQINNLLGEYCHAEVSFDSPCDILVNYPKTIKSDYIRPNIKLEIGPLAKGTPNNPTTVKSYIAEELPQITENPITISTVSVARTFWEKITILHYLHSFPEERPVPARHSRHYYDVFMICKSPYFQEALSKKELFSEIVEFDHKYYPKPWVDYSAMTLGNLTVAPEEKVLSALKTDYNYMKDMIFHEIPTWDEINANLVELETMFGSRR